MRLDAVLVEAGVLTAEEIQEAVAEQRTRPGKSLAEVIVDLHLLREEDLCGAVANALQMPLVDLEKVSVAASAHEIPKAFLTRNLVLPIEASGPGFTVALADPFAPNPLEALNLNKGPLTEVLARPSQLKKRIAALVAAGEAGELMRQQPARSAEPPPRSPQENSGAKEVSLLDVLSQVPTDVERSEPTTDVLKDEADAPPVIRLVNQILITGLQKKASDIHLLPQSRGLVVAYRLNGDLVEETVIDQRLQRQIVSRLKIASGMDIAERRLPQDGRLLLNRDGKAVELRVSCIPNAFGESMVMRVLNKEMAVDLKTLGLREQDREALLLLTERNFGLILVTGPTGSGKSTTLFGILREVIRQPLHVITIEDPIESEIAGVNQIQVNRKIDLTFSRVLRNILRHDPDVVMVGEMRDEETAAVGVEAALTGHLMLSTLHTNTAVDTVVRLTDMKVPPYLLAPALLGIVSQNLVKKLCPDCRKEAAPSGNLARLLERHALTLEGPIYDPVGCGRCNKTGFTGRTLLYEFLEVNEAVRGAIHRGLTGGELQEVALANGLFPKSLYAMDLAAKGIIAQEELVRSLI